jgi:hypothetical protein
LKPKPHLSAHSLRSHILFDLVVEIGHALIRVPHPELLETLGTTGTIPKMRVSKAPECMVARFAVAGEQVDEFQLLQRRMNADEEYLITV